MLDLTDNEEIEIIDRIWKSVDLEPKLNIKKKKITKIGDKLNFLFDFIPEFSKEYNIIKTIGENYKYNNHFFNNEKINSTKPGTSSKVIYNAKEINCIKNIGRVIEDE